MQPAARRQPAIPRTRIRTLGVLLGLSVAWGCRSPGVDPTPNEQKGIDKIAHEYVLLVLALGERDPDSLDFAIVPQPIRSQVHTSYPTLESIGRDAETLRAQLNRSSDPETGNRTAFLGNQLAALIARVAMLRGHVLPFDQEAAALFGVTVLPDQSAAQRQTIRQQVVNQLPPAHAASTSPANRYSAYQQRFVVPEDRLRPVMSAALEACRAATVAQMSLPAGEAVELAFVRNQPWAAFSRYQGGGRSLMQVNLDFPVTVDEALELACHEGYPGHHVFNTLREAALAGRPEAEVQPTFSPQSYVAEAAAAFAPRMAFSVEERVRVEREVLFPLAGLRGAEAARYVAICEQMRGLGSAEPGIARAYLDGSLDFVRAEEAMQREVLMSHAEAVLLYLNEYRSYMLAYTDGPERVAGLVGLPAAGGDRRAAWGRYVGLMTRMVYRLP